MQHNDNVIELTLTQPSCVAPGAHAARKLFVSAAFLWSPHGMSYEYATSGAARQPGQAVRSRSEPSFRIAPSGATTSGSHETCQHGRRGEGTGACGTCKCMPASCPRGLAWKHAIGRARFVNLYTVQQCTYVIVPAPPPPAARTSSWGASRQNRQKAVRESESPQQQQQNASRNGW